MAAKAEGKGAEADAKFDADMKKLRKEQEAKISAEKDKAQEAMVKSLAQMEAKKDAAILKANNA